MPGMTFAEAGAIQQQEVWKEIPGFEGDYEVSDLGRIRSISFRNKQTHRPRIEPKYLTPRPGTVQGHLKIMLYRDCIHHSHWLHRLILLAFVGPCPAGCDVGAHLDGNPGNNRADNLRWVTNSENCMHRVGHGTDSRGEKSWNAKLNANDVMAIRAAESASIRRRLAIQLGVSPGTVNDAYRRRTWRHLA